MVMNRKVDQTQEQVISKKIKALRLMKGIKIKELAAHIGVSYQQLYNYRLYFKIHCAIKFKVANVSFNISLF